jgi:hypothetical protein
MQTKDYSITLDMMRTLPFRPFEIVEGDTGNVLHVTLLNNGDAMDLSSSKLCITFASSSGFAMQDETSGIIKTEQPGTFDITLLPTAYGSGNVSADVQVYSGDGDATLITSTRFDFRCRKALISGDIIRANSAYPPLVEATRIANEAAVSALAAADRIDTDIGELNVQANWSETDDTSDAFIQNKPAIPTAPEDIGAAPSVHAARHASGETDAISPADILAAGKSILLSKTLLAANWQAINRASSTTYDDATGVYALTMRPEWAYAVNGIVCFTCPEAVASAATVYVKIGSSTYTCSTLPAWAADDDVAVKLLTGTTCEETSVSEEAPVFHDLVVAGITADCAVEVLPGPAITEDQLAELQAANLQDGGQAAGSITLKAFGDVPTLDIPIRVIVRGDLY